MAEWIPPKIDYWDTPRPVGGEDYKRIEGNIQYLYCLSHTGWVEPSDTVILQSTTTKQPTGSTLQVVKRFLIVNPGRYRIKVEGRVWGGPGSADLIRVAGHVFTNWSDTFSTKVFDTPPIPGLSYIDIEAANSIGTYSYYSAVRKVQICGTLTLNRPEAGVIID